MLHQRYYIIRPSAMLRERLVKFGELDISPILSETVLWEKPEPDRSGYSNDDHIYQMKLLFQMWLRHEYGHSHVYTEILGDALISIEAFDLWWELEKYGLEEHFEDIEQAISSEIVENVLAPDSPAIIKWLNALKSRSIPYIPSYSIPNIKFPPKHNRPQHIRKLPKDFPK